MTADQENCVLAARSSSKKRASVAPSPELPRLKKRVVLGELTNSSGLGMSQNSPIPKRKLEGENLEFESETRKRKDRSRKERKQDLPQEINTRSGELQKPANSSMYEYLHSLEIAESRRPSPNYMEEVQNDVTVNMREILVDWLVEVAEEYKLVSDTLYLTIMYIDRFLSSHPLSRNKLQLLGVSCMLIASKYEEISPPHVEDFCYITDNTYTKEELVNMEKDVLKFLNFEIGTPTTKNFLRILTKAAHENYKSPNLQLEFLCCYLAELSLLDYRCLRFLPSLLSASVIFLSRFTIQPVKHPWSMELQCISGYTPSDLKECVLAIYQLQLKSRGSSSYAVKDKYMKHKFKCVATLSLPSEIPACYFEAIDE